MAQQDIIRVSNAAELQWANKGILPVFVLVGCIIVPPPISLFLFLLSAYSY